MKHRNRLWLFIALLVAFALRVHLLNAQSLWNDEGTSVALASLSLPAIIDGAARDIHPPLYYILLHFWMPLAGITEYAIRFLSIVGGVLTVTVVFRIAYSVFDEEVAILAAFLVALSPFQVEYSQEARMYIWVTLFAAVSVLAMAQFVIQNSTGELRITNYELRIWLLYLAVTIAMLYTQYFGASVIVAENLAFAIWLFLAWRDQRPGIGHSVAWWIAAQVIVGLATAPWYLSVREQLAAWPSVSEEIALPTLLWRVLSIFSVGKSLDGILAAMAAVLLGVLFLIGWKRARDAHTNWVIATLVLWTFIPIAMIYLVSLSRPAYNPKFLLLATPPFFILAARGLRLVLGGWRLEIGDWRLITFYVLRFTFYVLRFTFYVLRFTLVSLILISNLQSLLNYYYAPRYARDNYRAIVQTIDANAREGDGILINAPGQIDVVRYYHRGMQPLFLLPRMRPPDPAATRADVDEMLAKVKRLFAIYWATDQSDPQGIVETRLAENAFKASDEWHGNVRLAVYGIATTPRAALQTIDAKIGGEIALQGYRLDARAARAGDVLTLALIWRAEQTPAARYKVFAHLLDASNRVVAQRDGEPVGDTRITTTWRAGETIADNYGIWIAPGTPPGEYRIEIGMYRADDGARLPIFARDGQSLGDHLILETVRVE